MAKNAKFTIYHLQFIKSNQAKIKYSVLLVRHRLKKLLFFHMVVRGVGGENNADVQSFDP